MKKRREFLRVRQRDFLSAKTRAANCTIPERGKRRRIDSVHSQTDRQKETFVLTNRPTRENTRILGALGDALPSPATSCLREFSSPSSSAVRTSGSRDRRESFSELSYFCPGAGASQAVCTFHFWVGVTVSLGPGTWWRFEDSGEGMASWQTQEHEIQVREDTG